MARFFSIVPIIIVIMMKIQAYKLMEDKYQTEVIYGNYSTDIPVNVSANKEVIIHFHDSPSQIPYTVYASSHQSDPDFPVFIMVRQQKEATSWEIPLLVKSRDGLMSYQKTSRTLCHNNINLITQLQRTMLQADNYDVQKFGLHKRLTMSVSTASEALINVTVRVEEQEKFYLKENQNISVTISPSEPRYFYYKYRDNEDVNSTGTVILEVESSDDTCLTVSIQNATCPVFDLNEDISYEGEYETVNTKGGIIIKENEFPNGFFVVFVSKGDNFDCDRKTSVIPLQNVQKIKPSNRSSIVTFKIKPNISKDEYLVASLTTLTVLLIFYVVFGVASCEFCYSENRRNPRRQVNAGNGYHTLRNEEEAEANPQPGGSGEVEKRSQNLNDTRRQIDFGNGYQTLHNKEEQDANPKPDGSSEVEQWSQNLDDTAYTNFTVGPGCSGAIVRSNPNLKEEIPAQASTETGKTVTFADSSGSSVYHSVREENERRTSREGSLNGIETIDQIPQEEQMNNVAATNGFDIIDKKLRCPVLYLSDLATKEPKHIQRESLNYFLHVLSIGIFYSVPVVQLVITQQRLLTITGNLDICYYNFLCAHPYMGLNDYNHVFSNLGYLLLGILFLIITRRHRQMRHNDHLGIPQHYGLFYAMGTALIMEGILSGCYHVCPNQSNFQFDTSFMYVMAVLCIIKLYQNRHPDINATAYVTFLILAIAVLIAMVGILNGHILIWTLFIILYSFLCLYVAIKIYFVNQSIRGLELVYQTKRNASVDGITGIAGVLEAIRPIKKARCISVVIVAILNIIMVNLGFLCHSSNVDFGTFLLALLMGNAIIYSFLYVTMKIINKERLSFQSVLYLILSGGLWGFATYFFVNNSSEWMVTPAESRQWNTQCTILNFYDYHDIWHLLSAPALFFCFMLLLTLDDKLDNTPRQEIVVF